MADSVVEQESRGRFVGGSAMGRIHRGHGIVAASSSIPSKYQTIVVDNSEKKGFMSKAKRFQDFRAINYNPGPGTYRDVTSNTNKECPSLSKRGTGTFASKMMRFRDQKHIRQPGPGEYEPVKLPMKYDFNKARVTSNFHAPIAVPVEERKHCQVPAPNAYKISKASGKVTKENRVSAQAAFKSGSKRENYFAKRNSSLPSPCHYHVNESLVHRAVAGTSAPFKSTTERKIVSTPDNSPGPASYNPFKTANIGVKLRPDKQRNHRHHHHHLSIAAPAVALPDVEPAPGPGHYNLVDYEGEEKRFMSGAVFVSTTGRWNPTPELDWEIPGPTSYRPRHVGKQSFIYNPSKKWIS